MKLRIAKKVWWRLLAGWKYPRRTVAAMARRTSVEWRTTARKGEL